MRDSVRVSVESDYDEESVRVYDDAGEVTAGKTTFRFSIDGDNLDRTEPREHPHDESAESADRRDPCYIAPLTEIPTDSTLRCEAVDGRRGMEIILRRESQTDVFAWRNSCPHKPKVPLDPGGGAIVDGDQIVCHEHGARFECDDGFCTYGPCRGDALDEVEIEVRDGDVFLADERFEACNRFD